MRTIIVTLTLNSSRRSPISEAVAPAEGCMACGAALEAETWAAESVGAEELIVIN